MCSESATAATELICPSQNYPVSRVCHGSHMLIVKRWQYSYAEMYLLWSSVRVSHVIATLAENQVENGSGKYK